MNSEEYPNWCDHTHIYLSSTDLHQWRNLHIFHTTSRCNYVFSSIVNKTT